MSMTSTAVLNLVEIRPWGALGKLHQIFYLYPLVLSNSPTRQTAYHMFMFNGSNDADSCMGVPFLTLVNIAAHLRDQVTQ